MEDHEGPKINFLVLHVSRPFTTRIHSALSRKFKEKNSPIPEVKVCINEKKLTAQVKTTWAHISCLLGDHNEPRFMEVTFKKRKVGDSYRDSYYPQKLERSRQSKRDRRL